MPRTQRLSPFSAAVITWVVAMLPAAACDEPAAAPEAGVYGQRAPTRGGTGKIYMGREIAHYISHRGAAWLEREERLIYEIPDDVVANLALEPDDVVADVGAGTGFFTVRISQQVGDGKVLAVDIQQEMLDLLQERLTAQGITNVTPVLGSAEDPGLPKGTVDLALMVDAYHEFSHPREMMLAIRESLKPEGRVVLIEYRAEQADVPIHTLHKMTEDQARRELESAGLRWIENRRFLPQQHFLVFEKTDSAARAP